MVKHYTDHELTEKLKELTIIVDTREKNLTPQIYFQSKGIPHIVRKLESGDYSAMLGDLTLEHDIIIERKAGLTELAGNWTTNRERFSREFTRAKAENTKPFLLVENDTIDDIFLGNYRSKFPAKSMWASLCTWMARYNTSVIFCRPENTGRIIYGIIYYYAREMLLTNG